MNELIEITQPNGDRAVAQAMHDAVVIRERELRAEFEAVAAKLTPESFGETKTDWTRLKRIDGELKDIIERVEAKSMEFAATDALLHQLTATRKNLAAMYKENWAKYVELRDAGKPKPTPREYLFEVYATEDDMLKLVKAAEKLGAKFRCEEVRAAAVQPKIDRIFEVVRDTSAK